MANEAQPMHVVVFPFLAHGHMIPALDIARLFATRDVKSTIITTPVNAPIFTKAIEHGNRTKDLNINVEIFRFPSQEVGLPEGCENREQVSGWGMSQLFFRATEMLQEQLEQYLEKARPTCLIADTFYPWATESTSSFNIPRLVFHGSGYFPLCAQDNILQYAPFKNISSDDEMCTLTPFPDKVAFLRTQVPKHFWGDEDNAHRKKMELIRKSELESYGVIVNSFYELESEYADFFRKELGRKTWHVGPVSLINRSFEEKALRGKQASIDEYECLAWLDSKKPCSVVYVSFGSITTFIASQLHEIANALENSGQNFIWVVRNVENEDWLPAMFEQRMDGKGLIIRGWAPQILILKHEAVGAFVTHCGWNSTLESISAGVPTVTWPMFADQFYIEKLVTQILKVGVSVGAKKWSMVPSAEHVIKSEAIEKGLMEILKGEMAEQMRHRAKELKEMAYNAVAEGGSSQSELTKLITELRSYHTQSRESS
ncbi:hypothetical protein RND81_14G235400 [Saponaria officinalis]|uniref:Glycosyltransferase n=1 Tax=Saponaria officinalis TaxID=3572 RepID=A0AAW1GVM7_SAPOF